VIDLDGASGSPAASLEMRVAVLEDVPRLIIDHAEADASAASEYLDVTRRARALLDTVHEGEGSTPAGR
jgi:hypothetical protein